MPPFLQDSVVRLLGGLILLMFATILWGLWVCGELHEGHWEEFKCWIKEKKMTKKQRACQKLMFSDLGFAIIGCRATGKPNHSPTQSGKIRDAIRYREGGEVRFTLENSRGLWSVGADKLRVNPVDLHLVQKRLANCVRPR